MHIILVANPKGGSGKTTLAVNLAGYYAAHGRRTGLFDLDRQQSALRWLVRRPANLARISGFDAREDDTVIEDSAGLDVAIIDAPAALRGERFKDIVRIADHAIIPVQPSVFDIDASAAFLERLIEQKSVRKARCLPGLIGNRVQARARSARQLETFIAGRGLPALGALRDSQVYVQTAASGITLFELPGRRQAADRASWQPLLDWLAIPAADPPD
ncbi:MAG TPA: ParA family protein [Plasticicumulans sp.]|uniref:ParA family protein n=1 Tax=Plasticicumulans sp. TaxID=2307179 RepID=UPI000F9F3EBF|nr:MAG: ParA family protein [Xanthomonadales bacterium]HMZ09185.1 ParA family protein [Plasticicumulans sp.]HNB90134.1 ParA family protein [Plasticicumulans sp.]HNJ06429.1 ParA family protein [Plasticicumulans sp.]